MAEIDYRLIASIPQAYMQGALGATTMEQNAIKTTALRQEMEQNAAYRQAAAGGGLYGALQPQGGAAPSPATASQTGALAPQRGSNQQVIGELSRRALLALQYGKTKEADTYTRLAKIYQEKGLMPNQIVSMFTGYMNMLDGLQISPEQKNEMLQKFVSSAPGISELVPTGAKLNFVSKDKYVVEKDFAADEGVVDPLGNPIVGRAKVVFDTQGRVVEASQDKPAEVPGTLKIIDAINAQRRAAGAKEYTYEQGLPIVTPNAVNQAIGQGMAGVNSGQGVVPPLAGGAPPTRGGLAAPPAPQPQPMAGGGKPLTPEIAAKYLAMAGGDKAKARAMAQRDGWSF